MSSRHGIAALLAAVFALAAQPALAACFELVGCTDSQYLSAKQLQKLSCDPLWTVRNTIYDENGYCFKTARAKEVFGNGGCSYMSAASVPLNTYERTNIQRVVGVEKAKGC